MHSPRLTRPGLSIGTSSQRTSWFDLTASQRCLDFGLAKLPSPDWHPSTTETVAESTLKTESGMIMGTAHYMSPEQVLGERWTIGQTYSAWVCCCMRWPPAPSLFRATARQPSSMRFSTRYTASPRQLNPDLSVELEHILTKALEKDREVRYQSVSELVRI